jgi:hypothetical protein
MEQTPIDPIIETIEDDAWQISADRGESPNESRFTLARIAYAAGLRRAVRMMGTLPRCSMRLIAEAEKYDPTPAPAPPPTMKAER